MARHSPAQSLTLAVATVAFGLALYFLVIAQLPGMRSAPSDSPRTVTAPSFAPDSLPRIASEEIAPDVVDDIVRPASEPDASAAELHGLLSRGEFKLARALLMERAAEAAAAGDHRQLGDTLLMLGQIAIEEQDLDAAEVYLLESLEQAEAVNDPANVAHVNLQLGRMHLRSRELARTAGEAYDLLLVARNELARGRYVESREKLLQVVDENLAIRRYGAAASAYETLGSLHNELHEAYLAEIALVEAARLHARSGQGLRAKRLIDRIRTSGIDANRLYFLEEEIDSLIQQFREDVAHMERARDYQRLYHHYTNRGDTERAWKLRILSSQSLARTAKRSLYQRQADVLAVLYDSNSAMEKARHHLNTASSQFRDQGLEELSTRSTALTEGIY